MKKHSVIVLGAVIGCLALIAPAFAQYGTAQVAELGVSPGLTISGHYGVFGDTSAYVGIYNLKVVGAPINLQLTQPSFCIEMQENQASWGSAEFQIVDLWNASKPKGPSGTTVGMGYEKADLMSKLFALKYNGLAGCDNNYAATFQAAVWDVVYGHGSENSAVRLNNSAITSAAYSWVNQARGSNVNFNKKLYGLTNASRQDYIIVGKDILETNAVPEPMSIMLGIMGLGSVAGFKKLRRK